ncbi:MAG: xanthine dehydrogenase accessory protein XdhC [Notoacmeibacter sp.]|nr:xanthine dehydrogenase accessory protein XdhC [Notoacmeibacter sp.]MCC0033593.1 xanthine dehydrogenase accessory protein XdhC [Brucellaceae bacterium]
MPDLSAFLDAHPEAVVVAVKEAKGSTPRGTDAFMLVAAEALHGTIGGGALEFAAIERARAIQRGREAEGDWRQPLGPEIGQCCGGQVTLSFRTLDGALRDQLLHTEEQARAGMAQVYLFGAGHVGRALAQALSPLPLAVTLVETRGEALRDLPTNVITRWTALPDDVVRSAPPGTAFVVLTHDHALDFLVVSEALNRGDADYVGMIGSATKRAVFRKWYLDHGGDEASLARLVCPIGGADVKDKRPSVIAALTAAELLRALAALKSCGS